MSADLREQLTRALQPIMTSWGVRSRHAQWSDAEAQRDAAREAVDAVLAIVDPLIADGMHEARQEGRAEVRERIKAALPDCYLLRNSVVTCLDMAGVATAANGWVWPKDLLCDVCKVRVAIEEGA